MQQRRIADYGVTVGRMQKGPGNRITDVPGVLVGHATVEDGDVLTGVTVVMPQAENPFYKKPVAAVHVLNGYGKSLGLVQVEELGTIETPIALTNTLNVGRVHDALVQYMLERSHAEGREPTSINPVVLECYDGRLSNIVRRPVGTGHVLEAIRTAGADFAEGSVGAGRGMICHGLKGGIGSASRLVELDGHAYTLGALVMTNHGSLQDLQIEGKPVGMELDKHMKAREVAERGSVIVIAATDLPVSDRQLRRILRRAPVGLARLGGYIGHGSGEIMIGFTTANTMPFEQGPDVIGQQIMREDRLDLAFRAIAECSEEAVLNSMICADTTTGYKGDVVVSLRDLWNELER